MLIRYIFVNRNKYLHKVFIFCALIEDRPVLGQYNDPAQEQPIIRAPVHPQDGILAEISIPVHVPVEAQVSQPRNLSEANQLLATSLVSSVL